MIEIDEQPAVKACAPCQRPITWLFSGRTLQWVPFHPDPSDTRTLHVHECDVFGRPPPSWRDRPDVPPETVHAGAERVRQALAMKESDS